MRFQRLALLAFAFPTFALAVVPVTREQCAAFTVKAVQERRFKDVVDLFAGSESLSQEKKGETLTKLSNIFARLGTLSNIKAIPRQPDGQTIKLEVTDTKPRFSSDKFTLVSHSMNAQVGGPMFLNISYETAQPGCELIAIAVHVPRADSGTGYMEFTFETSDEAALNQFVALLKEKKIRDFSITRTAVNDNVTAWKLMTLPFPTSEDTKVAMAFAQPFQQLKGTTTFTYGVSYANTGGKKASTH
jgi:hypothetical protein